MWQVVQEGVPAAKALSVLNSGWTSFLKCSSFLAPALIQSRTVVIFWSLGVALKCTPSGMRLLRIRRPRMLFLAGWPGAKMGRTGGSVEPALIPSQVERFKPR